MLRFLILEAKNCLRWVSEKKKNQTSEENPPSSQHLLECNSWIAYLHPAITKVCAAIRASQERNCSSEIHPGQGMITGFLTNMSDLIKQEGHKYQQIILAIKLLYWKQIVSVGFESGINGVYPDP